MSAHNDWEALMRSPWAAGAIGALVGLRGAPGNSWGERAFNVLCGSLIAGFGTPAAAEWFAVISPAMQGALSFALGLFGMNVIALATATVRSFNPQDIKDWLAAWVPGRRNTPKE